MFANQPTAVHADDGLVLTDCRIAPTCHCAPPQNKPTPEEIRNCRPYLVEELRLLENMRVVVALGKIAFDAVVSIFEKRFPEQPRSGRKPVFSHGAEHLLPNGLLLLGSYHPSQQNTFTGRLTEPMFDAIFDRARTVLSETPDNARQRRKSAIGETGLKPGLRC